MPKQWLYPPLSLSFSLSLCLRCVSAVPRWLLLLLPSARRLSAIVPQAAPRSLTARPSVLVHLCPEYVHPSVRLSVEYASSWRPADEAATGWRDLSAPRPPHPVLIHFPPCSPCWWRRTWSSCIAIPVEALLTGVHRSGKVVEPLVTSGHCVERSRCVCVLWSKSQQLIRRLCGFTPGGAVVIRLSIRYPPTHPPTHRPFSVSATRCTLAIDGWCYDTEHDNIPVTDRLSSSLYIHQCDQFIRSCFTVW